jgi:integrase-like protein
MHPVVSPTMANEPTTRKAEIPSSDANQPQLKFVVSYREAAKRKHKAFETEDEAIDFVRTKNPNFRRDVHDADAQASERILLDCSNRLNARGKTIKDATDFFIQHLLVDEKSCTAAKLVDEVIAAKQKEAASAFNIDELRSHLTSFGKRFGSQPVATITSAEIDDWLRSLNVSIVTRNRYRQLIMQAFSFAVEHGYANSNPVFGRFILSRPLSL